MEISIYFAGRFRKGDHGYYAGRKRGNVAVWHDSQLYLYYQPVDCLRKQFKNALKRRFCANGEKITGKYPSFTINQGD